MSLEIQIDTSQLKNLPTSEEVAKIVTANINDGIRKSLVYLWGQEKQEAPFGVVGNLKDGWDINIGVMEGTFKSKTSYGFFVENGSSPHSAPIIALQPWADKKGIPVGALWMSIKQKGTKANPFLERAVDNSKEAITKIMNESIDDILKFI